MFSSTVRHAVHAAHHPLQGGLGGVRFPMVADITKQISKDYDILIEEGENAGVALRCGASLPPASHGPLIAACSYCRSSLP